jgi:TatD DNase family protein
MSLNNNGDTASTLLIFDTHAHLDLLPFEADCAALVRRLETGTFPGGLAPEELEGQPIEIAGIVIPGIDAASCQRVHKMAALSHRFHVAVGIHPNHTAESTDDDWNIITELARHDNVIAIGETGLDRYWDNAPIEVQREMFHRHIELSQETGKPILIHCRDAWEEMLPILHQVGTLRGVIHAFSGNTEHMAACVELGLFISFAGSVTYRNSKFAPLWEAARKVPGERLLIETDAPFMIPHPLRGKLPRNEPTLAALTALRLAELREVSLQTIAETTTHNAFQFFGLGDVRRSV